MGTRRDLSLAKSMAKKIFAFRQKKYPKFGGQKRCAQDFGVLPQQWAKWESGISAPDPVNQAKLAKFFGVSQAELRGDDGVIHVRAPEISREMKDLLALSGNMVIALQHCQTAAISGKITETQFADVIQDLVGVFRRHLERVKVSGASQALGA